MRSLFAGVSGLRNHQTRMDVVGNNVANVNTVAFKASRVTFKEAFAQLLQGASRPPGDTGGINPIQIGSGMNIGTIDQMFTQGSLESTGQNTDMAIQGNGFFVVSDGQRRVFTRAGNFQLDADGRLIAPNNGFVVQGINADDTGNFSAASAITDIRLPLGQKSPARSTARVTLTGNLDQNADGGGTITTNPGGLITGLAVTQGTPAQGTYVIDHAAGGTLRMTGPGGFDQTITAGTAGAQVVEFTQAGVTVQVALGTGYNPNPASGSIDGATFGLNELTSQHAMGITVYDGAGAPHNLQIVFSKQSTPGTWQWTASIAGNTASITGALPTDAPAGSVQFSGTGSLQAFPVSTLTITPSQGAPAFQVTIDPGTINGIDGLAGFARQSNAVINSQDGYQAGDLTNFSVDKFGVVTGFFSNGVSRSLAQLTLAGFNNPSGLLRTGDNMYEESANSGNAVLGFAGISNTSTITPGALENSNVDISAEFTNMIVTQRGFQANSRVITTSDEMLQELVNLKR
ncbi:MAG: flagellar hook-basal body complex protein [Gemmatimonadales bacterium]|nr:flagellar hook-basal body complex protein [Gemmatimonadales bacterium]